MSNDCSLKYPLLMVHGMGFRDDKFFSYWGRIPKTLEEMGCKVVKYYATEIDKYAIKTTLHNFPNTIQLGDAFQVREGGWHI